MAKRAIAAVALALALGVVIGFGVGAATSTGDATPAGRASARPSPSPSPVDLVKVGGVYLAARSFDLPAEVEPYAYTRPGPPRETTPIDGTYLRVLTIDEVGGPLVGLPYRCLRCIPFRRDAGLSTLIFFEGRYFLEHQISGFRASGHFTVDGATLTLYNDSNCSSMEGTYRWSRAKGRLRLRVIDDPCPFDELRTADLTFRPWVKVNQCFHRLVDLWPAVVGCRSTSDDG
ncbi:MAG TPA: hypothetical protein VIE12_02380 [Actinomycetota bacterium]|jgi:hypothetical protein